MFARDLLHPHQTLQAQLRALYALKGGMATISSGFRPEYLKLLEAFGNPHLHLPPVIHVAGTNGKGSTIAFMRAILEAAGLKVHVYTSPHLVQFNERIVLAGREIDDDSLKDLIDEAIRLNDNRAVTFFEITTAMAFAAFASNPADVVLLETGMGGRLDCTNVVEHPIMTVITSIAYDHQEFLGYNVQAIATEKAGIMKPGAPCVLGHQNYAVQGVFQARAEALAVSLYREAVDWQVAMEEDAAHFSFGADAYHFKTIGLKGLYQIYNVGSACAALSVLKDRWDLKPEHFVKGIGTAHWPARLENVTARSLLPLPQGWELWIDGAHNESGAMALLQQLQKWNMEDEAYGRDASPLYIIIGMMRHKDPAGFVSVLLQMNPEIHVISIPDEPEAFSAVQLQDRLKSITTSKAHDSLSQALEYIVRQNSPGRILITGSLYLAGYVMQTALSETL